MKRLSFLTLITKKSMTSPLLKVFSHRQVTNATLVELRWKRFYASAKTERLNRLLRSPNVPLSRSGKLPKGALVCLEK
jgi:hypothetical protein